MTYDALKVRLFRLIESELTYALHPSQTIGDAIAKACDGSGRGRAELRQDLQSLRMDLHVVQSEEGISRCVRGFLNKWAPEEQVLDVGRALDAGDRSMPTPSEVDLAQRMAALDDVAEKPGQKFDSAKARYDLLPFAALESVVDVLTYGAKKYAPDQWRDVPEARRRYFAAALRHLVAWWGGERLDKESGLHHLAHATCCVMFLLDVEAKLPP